MIPVFLRCINPSLILTACIIPFRGLQGVKLFCAVVILGFFDMGSQFAGARKPLQFGLAVAIAIETGWILYHAVASFAFFNYRMTFSSVVGTSFLPHVDALRSCLDCLTNHGYHLPSD
jgi:hypothetical protein